MDKNKKRSKQSTEPVYKYVQYNRDLATSKRNSLDDRINWANFDKVYYDGEELDIYYDDEFKEENKVK